MTWLVLFDVDGTLLLTHDEVYVEANNLALTEVYGTAPDAPDVPGDTATAQTRLALARAGFTGRQIDEGLIRWCETFSAQYVQLLADADTSHWERAPGAREALAALEHPALLTGNPRPVARARMQRLGLDGYFPVGQGAFGCEREPRSALFGLARERAGSWPTGRTVGVGDTPLDISSAHDAGCRCIAVATGRYGRAELASADAVISTLEDLPAGCGHFTNSRRSIHRAIGDDARPVALNEANAGFPISRRSRRSESAVISALTGPMETRTRLPSSVIPRMGALIRFMAESSGATVEIVMSHG